jgi:hypothetical protein
VPIHSLHNIQRIPSDIKKDIKITGSIKLADAHTAPSITSSDIAYISCDSNSNSSNISPSDLVTQAVAQTPRAIMLYTLVGHHCNLSGSFPGPSGKLYTSILTMTNPSDSNMLQSILATAEGQPTAIIQDSTMANKGSSSTGSGSQDNGSPAPTTAVAMSILYSITGIITLLFLAIIATGAVRAHRHPERYGPRGGNAGGRPRQSRAKGLARAMLETLPIVKFGDPEPAKPGSGDVELAGGENSSNALPKTSGSEGHNPEDETKAQAVAPGSTEHDTSTAIGVSNKAVEQSEILGCSICTEDFEKGEDVRVLPCNHKYHPACIDPWLLNVSGTCPLW